MHKMRWVVGRDRHNTPTHPTHLSKPERKHGKTVCHFCKICSGTAGWRGHKKGAVHSQWGGLRYWNIFGLECVQFALECHKCISFAGFSFTWPGKTSIRSVYRAIANPGPTMSWKVTVHSWHVVLAMIQPTTHNKARQGRNSEPWMTSIYIKTYTNWNQFVQSAVCFSMFSLLRKVAQLRAEVLELQDMPIAISMNIQKAVQIRF